MTSLSTMKTIDYIGIDVSKKILQIDAANLAPTCPIRPKLSIFGCDNSRPEPTWCSKPAEATKNS